MPPALPPPILVDPKGIVIGDVLCRGCSYNLRSLRADSKCPECAAAIELSLRGNLLRYCDPAWLDGVGFGIVLCLGALLISTFLSLRLPLSYFTRPVQMSIGLIANALGFAGTWLLTRPDPGAQEERGIKVARVLARTGMSIAVIRGIMLFLADRLDPSLSALFGLGFLLAAIARTAAEVSRLYYIRQIALRIPDDKLAKRAKSLIWTYALPLGFWAIEGAALTFITMTLKQRLYYLNTALFWTRVLSGLAWLATIIFGVVYIFMLIRFGRAIEAQRTIARIMWHTPEPQETSSRDFSGSDRGGGTSGS